MAMRKLDNGCTGKLYISCSAIKSPSGAIEQLAPIGEESRRQSIFRRIGLPDRGLEILNSNHLKQGPKKLLILAATIEAVAPFIYAIF